MNDTGMTAVRSKIKSMAWLAEQLGISRGAVSQWEKVPAERVGDLARITGLTPSVIRPDIFAEAKEPAQ